MGECGNTIKSEIILNRLNGRLVFVFIILHNVYYKS